MGSGEGYGMAVECTRDSGFGQKPWGKLVWFWREVFINILLGFPGPSDGLRLHPTVFFSSGSGLTADSSVLTLTLAFLDFGLDFAQSFPFHAQSPTTSVPSPTYVSRSIAPTPANILAPRKRFRDSYSPEDSREEHMEVDTVDAEAVADVGISEGVVAHPEDGVDTREIVVDPLAIGDSSESSRGGIPNFEDTIYDIVHYMSEVRIDRINEIETTQRQLETS
ncbi:hypothetical protein Tco_1368164 [Tanacetum coccineum]